MKIRRVYQDLGNYLSVNKVLVIYGPRQVGKTTLLNDFLSETNFKYKLVSGEDISLYDVLGSSNIEKIKEFVSGYELIVIDEARKIPNIGLALKIMVDHIKDIRVIATGSSSFELAGQIGEPLTGRKTTLNMYPISQIELSYIYNKYELKENLSKYLIFGSYPEVITLESKQSKIDLLHELVNSYLLKDILEFERVKNSKILLDLLRLLAFQIGSEVSLSELASKLQIDSKTVARYIDLLEKSFIVFSLRGYSRNLRKEITKKNKYYFYDIGLRNAIISNFNDIEIRNDVGMLWENFVIIERLKKQSYQKIYANNYFWRTWDKKEIDFVEEKDGKLFGYEMKWSDRKVNEPKDWKDNYTNASFEVISKETYLDFLL